MLPKHIKILINCNDTVVTGKALIEVPEVLKCIKIVAYLRPSKLVENKTSIEQVMNSNLIREHKKELCVVNNGRTGKTSNTKSKN